jgi:hypothetical protein
MRLGNDYPADGSGVGCSRVLAFSFCTFSLLLIISLLFFLLFFPALKISEYSKSNHVAQSLMEVFYAFSAASALAGLSL